MKKARRKIADMQKRERGAGFGTPAEGPLSDHIATAVFAIQAGITTENWDHVAEAQVMLIECAMRAREVEGKTGKGCLSEMGMKGH